MIKTNIVVRLRDAARQQMTLTGDAWQAQLLHEAADEIEYLRQRCEQIDNEWRQREADLQAGVRSRKEGWG